MKQRQPTSDQDIAPEQEQESEQQSASDSGAQQEAGNSVAATQAAPAGMESEVSGGTPALDAANQELGGEGEGDDGEQASGGYAEASPSGGDEPADSANSGGGGGGGGGGDEGAAASALGSAASGSTGVSNDSGPVPTSAPPAQADAAAGNSAVGSSASGGLTASDVAAGTGNADSAAATAADASELLAGEDVPEIMGNYQSALPSEQAATWTAVGSEVNSKGTEEESAFQESLPDFKAVMVGEEGAAEGAAVEAPSGDSNKVDDSPGATPDAPVKETVDPGAYKAGFSPSLGGFSEGEDANTEDNARKIGQSLNRLPQGDSNVDTNPGPPPPIPLKGESDPQRVGTKMQDGMAESEAARADARQKVIDSPGAEQVQPTAVDETYTMEGLAMPNFGETKMDDGHQKFDEIGLSDDVIMGFDGDYGAGLQANLMDAKGEVDTANTQRDADRETEVSTAKEQQDTMITEAQSEQERVVLEERQKINDKRSDTVQAQEKATKDVEKEARSKQAAASQSINQRVSADQAKIDSEFSKAKSSADSEVKKGENKAASEKRKAEQKASKKSWWQKACDFVADALASIANVISGIFDAVRSAVNSIIDGVKALANSIIDAACKFICDAIAAFGDFLKGAIQGLLGDIFPGLADALCSFVDAAVDYAQSKVQELAQGLKDGIAALCDAVAGAINAILSVYEGLIQGALAIAQAVITGDWNAVLLMALDAALKLAGISPDEFYAMMGKAEDTLDFILKNPGTFLGNCISAVATGFGNFADNFMDHLKKGFVDWLTGQAGDTGVEMPDTLDLAGVLDIVLQVLGLTKDNLREKAVEHLGEENVEQLEFVWGFVESAIQGGLAGLWEHVQQYLDSLWDMVIGAIQEWLMEKIIVAAVTKIVSMFNPIGAIVQALLTAWNLYCWVKEEIARIMGVVNAVVNGITDIAMGNIGGAADAVEGALADLVPTAINLLANILGLGGVGAKVKEIITGIQQTVSDAIDKMIEKVKGFFKGGDDKEEGEEEDPEKAAEEEEDPDGKSTPKLSGDWSIPAAFAYRHTEEGQPEQVAQLQANGSFSLKVVNQDALDQQFKRSDGYDNESIRSSVNSKVAASVTNVIANSGKPIVEVLMASSYSGFASSAQTTATSSLSGVGLEISGLQIEYIDGGAFSAAIDTAAAAAIADLPTVNFTDGGGNAHELFFQGEGSPKLYVASKNPMPVGDATNDGGTFAGVDGADESKADSSASSADQEAAAVLAGSEGSAEKVPKIRETLDSVAAALDNEVMDDIAVDPETTLDTEHYKEFEARFGDIAGKVNLGGTTAEAKEIWLKAIGAIQGVNADWKEAKNYVEHDEAGNAIETRRKDLSASVFQDTIIPQFQDLVDLLEDYFRAQTTNAGSWGFWSGQPGAQMAKDNSDISLESSVMGGLFDGMALGAHWTDGLTLWTALSNAYATYAAEKIEERTYLGFLGKDSTQTASIFNQIEQKTFSKLLEKQKKGDVKVTWYACLGTEESDRKTPDTTVSGGGLPGTIDSVEGGLSNGRDTMAEKATAANAESADGGGNEELPEPQQFSASGEGHTASVEGEEGNTEVHIESRKQRYTEHGKHVDTQLSKVKMALQFANQKQQVYETSRLQSGYDSAMTAGATAEQNPTDANLSAVQSQFSSVWELLGGHLGVISSVITRNFENSEDETSQNDTDQPATETTQPATETTEAEAPDLTPLLAEIDTQFNKIQAAVTTAEANSPADLELSDMERLYGAQEKAKELYTAAKSEKDPDKLNSTLSSLKALIPTIEAISEQWAAQKAAEDEDITTVPESDGQDEDITTVPESDGQDEDITTVPESDGQDVDITTVPESDGQDEDITTVPEVVPPSPWGESGLTDADKETFSSKKADLGGICTAAKTFGAKVHAYCNKYSQEDWAAELLYSIGKAQAAYDAVTWDDCWLGQTSTSNYKSTITEFDGYKQTVLTLTQNLNTVVANHKTKLKGNQPEITSMKGETQQVASKEVSPVNTAGNEAGGDLDSVIEKQGEIEQAVTGLAPHQESLDGRTAAELEEQQDNLGLADGQEGEELATKDSGWLSTIGGYLKSGWEALKTPLLVAGGGIAAIAALIALIAFGGPIATFLAPILAIAGGVLAISSLIARYQAFDSAYDNNSLDRNSTPARNLTMAITNIAVYAAGLLLFFAALPLAAPTLVALKTGMLLFQGINYFFTAAGHFNKTRQADSVPMLESTLLEDIPAQLEAMDADISVQEEALSDIQSNAP